MPLEVKTIPELQREAYANAQAHGFTSPSFGEQIALMHSELSEAFEEFRSGRNRVWYGEDGKPEGVPMELADVAIRLFDTAERLGLDLQYFIEKKMAFNATRPFRHGGKVL